MEALVETSTAKITKAGFKVMTFAAVVLTGHAKPMYSPRAHAMPGPPTTQHPVPRPR